MNIPVAVKKVLSRLGEHGYEGYAVGGCVRDSLLSKHPNDWDITTSAEPNETCKVFFDCRVIETGIEHGTVTVLMDGMPLEITTYRTDGEYRDHRHPVAVTFARSLEEDLSRRDFTVNAMAYHPDRGVVDLFGGKSDLEQRIIRCVGEPFRRFDEDGLRILRALRFAAVLDFDIHPATAQAVHACKGLLSHIAAERIREEFCKLLCGKGAVRILRNYRDVIEIFLPDIKVPDEAYEQLLIALERNRSSDLIVRLSLLIGSVTRSLPDAEGGALAGRILRGLRFDNATVTAVAQLVAQQDLPLCAEERAVKRLMQKLSREQILRLLEVKRCQCLAQSRGDGDLCPEFDQIPVVMDALLAEGVCLSLRDLAVKGGDLQSIGIQAGKSLGMMLDLLLEQVMDGVVPNEKEALLAQARKNMQ